MKIYVHDIIGILLIAGVFTLKCFGIDHVVDEVLLGIVAFYFGSKVKIKEK